MLILFPLFLSAFSFAHSEPVTVLNRRVVKVQETIAASQGQTPWAWSEGSYRARVTWTDQTEKTPVQNETIQAHFQIVTMADCREKPMGYFQDSPENRWQPAIQDGRDQWSIGFSALHQGRTKYITLSHLKIDRKVIRGEAEVLDLEFNRSAIGKVEVNYLSQSLEIEIKKVTMSFNVLPFQEEEDPSVQFVRVPDLGQISGTMVQHKKNPENFSLCSSMTYRGLIGTTYSYFDEPYFSIPAMEVDTGTLMDYLTRGKVWTWSPQKKTVSTQSTILPASIDIFF